MIHALDRAFTEHAGNSGMRAALIDHEGPHFSFGASVEEHLPGQCAAMLKDLHALVLRMLEWPAPILVAARGQCLGGGLELACAGNFLYAAPEAQFGQPEIKLAVFAPAASCLLPPRIGQLRAEDLLFSGRSIDVRAALEWGLVNEMAEDPAAAALAYFDAHLAGKSASSLGYALKAVRAPLIARLRDRLAEVESLYLNGLMKTRDAVEGLQAFLDKRTPKWEHK
jgi:cyclohexa-1,5-dienecarbonyl-CoA hydratase